MRMAKIRILRSLFMALLFLAFFSLFGAEARAALNEEVRSSLCLYSSQTGASVSLDILDNGFVVGDFCIDGCGCGSILGEAHIADVDGTQYGTIDLYADLAEVCAYGVWYSIDMPSLSHIWYYTGLESTQYSGTGEFEEISCFLP